MKPNGETSRSQNNCLNLRIPGPRRSGESYGKAMTIEGALLKLLFERIELLLKVLNLRLQGCHFLLQK